MADEGLWAHYRGHAGKVKISISGEAFFSEFMIHEVLTAVTIPGECRAESLHAKRRRIYA